MIRPFRVQQGTNTQHDALIFASLACHRKGTLAICRPLSAMFYDLPHESPPGEPLPPRRFPLWIGLLLACLLLIAIGLGLRGCRHKTAPADPLPAEPAPVEPAAAKPQGPIYGFPTAQRDLQNTNSLDVYQ